MSAKVEELHTMAIVQGTVISNIAKTLHKLRKDSKQINQKAIQLRINSNGFDKERRK